MATTVKKKINYAKIILVTLAVIGSITIIDNSFRLTRELINTVRSHSWSTSFIK